MSTRPTLVSYQRWKLWICGIGVTSVAVVLLADKPIGRLLGTEPSLVGLAGSAFGLLVFIVASLLIRCPSCGLSLVWHGVSTHSANLWLSWLLNAEECPQCGFPHALGKSNSSGRIDG